MKKALLLLTIAVSMPLWVMAQTPPQPSTPTPTLTPTPTPVPPKAMPIPAAPVLSANSYILVDFNSGKVLVENNPDMRVEPASITKVMTSYVIFTELAAGNIKVTDTVTVSENAWRTEGSRMFIDPSMVVTVEQLIKGMVIQSGNDACVALAEHLAGTEEAFAGLMNHYAEQLGMTNSHFMNSTGLPHADHYTTARDVATLSAALIRQFPQYYHWYAEKEFSFNNIRQHNRNNLLWRDPAVDGLKTGHTEAAGYCLAASAKRDGMRLVSVVLGSGSEQARINESQSMLNYGFRFFETVQLYKAGQELAQGKVWKGEKDQVRLGIRDDLFVTIPRGRYEDLDAKIDMRPELIAPIAEGDEVGQISIHLEEAIISNPDLIALEAIPAAGFFGRAWDGMSMWFSDLFGDD